MQDDERDGAGWEAHDWARYVGALEVLLSAEQFPRTVRHVALRAQFSQLMLDDARIVEAVRRVPRRRLDEATAQATALGDDGQASTSAELLRWRVEYDRWTRGLVRALRQALVAFEAPRLPGGFRWPWLLYDLALAYARFYIDDQAIGHARPLLHYVVDRAPRRLVVETMPGETNREVQSRLRRMLKPAPSAGRVPTKKLEDGSLVRYAVWFYRHHALGETLDAVAHEYHDAEHAHTGKRYGRTKGPRGQERKDRCDDRPTIKAGIRQAERYLRAFPSHARPDDGEK